MAQPLDFSAYNTTPVSSIYDKSYKGNKLEIGNLSEKYQYYNITISHFSIFSDYYDIIMSETKSYELPDALLYKPEHIAHYLYGTPDLFFLVLFTNDIGSYMELTNNKVRLLPPDKLHIINKIIEKNKHRINTAEPLNVSNMVIKPF